jgi:ABC-type lipoprotein release transport system permease subunit
MITLLKIAWRNLWRNRRRTLITVASIFFGVVLATYTTSMQEGSYEFYIKSITEFYSGHLQVHDTAWWTDRSVNNTFVPPKKLVDGIRGLPAVRMQTNRLESFALASHGNATRGVAVMGIVPASEDSLTALQRKLIAGEYLGEKDEGIMIAAGVAEYLHLGIGDTLALISQGYHGSSAAGLFPVKGIIKHPSPALNNQLVIMTLARSQDFFSVPGGVTSVVIMLGSNTNLDAVNGQVKTLTGDGLKVMTWAEMQPELLQQIESDRVSNGMMKVLLYILISFGILGTIIMMMKERRREIGVMVAMGLQKYRLAWLLVAETFLLSLTGVIAGIAGSIPLVFYFHYHPIPFTGQAAEAMLQYGWEPVLMFSCSFDVFSRQALLVFLLTLLVAIYPLLHIRRLEVVSWLKS